jgi:hypothetical protein
MKKKRKLSEKSFMIREFKKDYYDAFGIIITISEVRPVLKYVEDPAFIAAAEMEEIFNNYIAVNEMNAYANFLCTDRRREKVEMRMIFMKMLRQEGYTVKNIGKYCNGRDHTTAIYNIKMANDLLNYSESFYRLYTEMAKEVKLQKKIKKRINRIYGRTINVVPETPAVTEPNHAPAAHKNEDKGGKHSTTGQFRGKLAYTKGLPQQRVSFAPKSRNPAY